MARGFRGTDDCLMTKEKILKELERVKWFLWHGNVFRADETLTDLMFEVDGAIEEDREARRPALLALKKLARALEEFGTYIDNNASGIVNYRERHWCGERISTGFVESTINQLVAKRFVKKQQMRWTPRGAHLLLQIRVQALNDDLQTSFNRSYPKLGRPCEEKLAAWALPTSGYSLSTGESPGNRYRHTGRPVRGGDPRGSKLRRAFRRISPPPFRRLPASSSSDVPETGPISSEDIGLLRAVRGQIILAMKTVRWEESLELDDESTRGLTRPMASIPRWAYDPSLDRCVAGAL
jgi:hypothetical protein